MCPYNRAGAPAKTEMKLLFSGVAVLLNCPHGLSHVADWHLQAPLLRCLGARLILCHQPARIRPEDVNLETRQISGLLCTIRSALSVIIILSRSLGLEIDQSRLLDCQEWAKAPCSRQHLSATYLARPCRCAQLSKTESLLKRETF